MEPGTFRGVIGRYWWESTPWWPDPVRPPAGAPNVLLVVLDDVGFAQFGCFGGSIDTPVIDGLAAGGLRYVNFHTTALCSPTRACLLTGRNHHRNGMGRIADFASGFPGYDARIPRANGFLSEILRDAGYSTWAVGKWHLTPEDETHLAATRARWPLGRGFERFYGFHGGETHQFAPWLVHDNHFVDPPRTHDEGYHLSEDLADQAITYLRDLRSVDGDKPFFCYLAFGACHSPHQAPPAWIERYRGRFDHGWDAERERILARQLEAGILPPGTRLSPRPEWVPAWDTLSGDERRLYARYMEAFAGFLSHADHQLGRLLDALTETGDAERTLVVVCSDNGASSEGGPTGSVNDVRPWNLAERPLAEALARIDEIGGPRLHNNYPWGWTVAGNTPFRRWKREVHEGGVADPLVVAWPAGIRAPGGTRRHYVHAIDVAPTVLAACGIEPPAEIDGIPQTPMDGVSFAATFTDPGAPAVRRTQYYEMFGCRALYHGGWKAVTYHPIHVADPGLDHAAWELYHVETDPSECDDLAGTEPERLRRMVELWWAEAARNQVLPVDNRPFSSFTLERPDPRPERTRVRFWPGTGMVPEEAVPSLHNRSHRIVAVTDPLPAAGVEGVLVALGNLQGGFTFFVRDGRLCYVHNLVGQVWHRVVATEPVPAGARELSATLTKTGEHRLAVTLGVDGRVVGEGEVPRFTPIRFNLVGAGLTVGADRGLEVCDDYRAPFPFTGRLRHVEIEVTGDRFLDPKAAAEVAVTRQ